MNVIFAGTPASSAKILKKMHSDGINIKLVISQPDKRSKRGSKEESSDVSKEANELGLDLIKPIDLNSKELKKLILSLNIDFLVVSAYGKIIPEWLLNHPTKLALNVHFSLLPKYRGASPIQSVLVHGDNETGISVMKINEKLDSGPTCNNYKIKLDCNKNAQEISEELSLLAAEKILDNIDDILDDKAKFIDQEHSKATYAKKIEKTEGKINWNDEASIILGKINGLFPSPGAFFIFKGERYKILKAEIGSGQGKAGEVLNNELEIACKNNKSIKIQEIQRQGKNPQKTSEFMLGSQIKKGTLISDA